MYCCETLNALSFKWSSWDEAYGPKEQPETIKQLITLTQAPHMQPSWGGTPRINGMNCSETLNALSSKWSILDEA